MFLNSPNPIIGPGAKITSPTIQRLQQDGVIDKTTNYKVDDLLSDIRDLRLKGRTVKGDPKLTLDGRQARDYAAELSSDYYEAVKNSGMPHAKQLANQYLATDKKYARGAEMLRYLKQPEIVDEDARLNMPLLQRQMKVERAYGLSHAFEPDEFKNLMDAVFRGADSSVVDKVIKGEPYLSMHATERGSLGLRGNLLNMLRNNKYAGNYDVDFLKPKPVAVGLQRLPAGAVKSFNRPISLAAPEDDSSE